MTDIRCSICKKPAKNTKYPCIYCSGNQWGKPEIVNEYENFKEAKSNFIDNITINKIEKIRSENNKNWMNLLRLALKYAPEEAKEIFNKITECDMKISKLMKEI